MRKSADLRAQRGVTLVVGLIMLVVITLVVTAGFMLSRSSLQSVGNMQFRNEAMAATNKALATVIGSPFTNAPAAQTINVDLNNDGVTDYVVNFTVPTCVQATQAGTATPSSLSLPTSMSNSATWETLWDLSGTVTSYQNTTGATMEIHEGVRVLLSQAQKDAVCP